MNSTRAGHRITRKKNRRMSSVCAFLSVYKHVLDQYRSQSLPASPESQKGRPGKGRGDLEQVLVTKTVKFQHLLLVSFLVHSGRCIYCASLPYSSVHILWPVKSRGTVQAATKSGTQGKYPSLTAWNSQSRQMPVAGSVPPILFPHRPF